MQPRRDLAWRVGGPQGSGVDTAANFFARAAAYGGLHVFGRREYYSNIMGRHSYFDVRVAPHPLTAHRSSVDVLATFEAETLVRHAGAVVAGGAIFYNEKDADTEFGKITYLDAGVRAQMTADLAAQDLPPTSAGVLEAARRRGVLVIPVPYGDIAKTLRAELDVPQTTADRMTNTVAVALSAALLGYDPAYLRQALAKAFSSRLVDMNMHAVSKAYDFVKAQAGVSAFSFRLEPAETAESRLFTTGTQASALGKMAGGLAFQSYYPISPSTDESVFLEGQGTFPTTDGGKGAVLVVQTEDELSAVTMAIGAALTGARSSTATSGPGFSLMVEALGWAGVNEVPLVISNYQRGGPSTGLPTRTEQGDLQFSVRAGHGDFPRIVMASGDVSECFYDAAQALNYAEQYQTPVIHLLDKLLTSTTQTIAPFAVGEVTIDRGELLPFPADDAPAEMKSDPVGYQRFAVTESGLSPRPVMGQPGYTHWVTGGEHTERGRVTEDPITREAQMEKRARKLELAARQIPRHEKLQVYGDANAALTMLSWGSNKGALLETLELLAASGIKARFIQVRMFSPFPVAELTELLASASPLVCVEANFSGQFAQLLREQTGIVCDHLILKYNGRPIAAEELHPALVSIRGGQADARIVLRNPYE